MSESVLWGVIAASAVINYLIRVTPFLVTRWDKVPRPIRRFLTLLPLAALGALIFPGAITAYPGNPWAGVVGLAAAGVAARFSKNLIVPVAASVAAVWLALKFLPAAA